MAFIRHCNHATPDKPLMVRDIVIFQNEKCKFGEYHGFVNSFSRTRAINSETKFSLIQRMADHIRHLSNDVKEIHLRDNFTKKDGEMAIKPDKVNTITRATLQEFHFYPIKENGPLTQDDFYNLIGKVEEIASKLPENLHMILASMPVMDSKRQVHNMVIYMQCGDRPVISSFAKAMPSHLDIKYPDTCSPYFRSVNTYLVLDFPFAGMPEAGGEGVVYGGNITFTTLGGVTSSSVIDICLDHMHAVGKFKFMEAMNKKSHPSLFFIPTTASHIVTSNTMNIHYENTVVSRVVQSDPDNALITSPIDDYDIGHGTRINNTTFGGPGYMVVFDLRPIESLLEPINTKVNKHNLMVKQNRWNEIRKNNPHAHEKIDRLQHKYK